MEKCGTFGVWKVSLQPEECRLILYSADLESKEFLGSVIDCRMKTN
jgi:hypothetical protein